MSPAPILPVTDDLLASTMIPTMNSDVRGHGHALALEFAIPAACDRTGGNR